MSCLLTCYYKCNIYKVSHQVMYVWAGALCLHVATSVTSSWFLIRWRQCELEPCMYILLKMKNIYGFSSSNISMDWSVVLMCYHKSDFCSYIFLHKCNIHYGFSFVFTWYHKYDIYMVSHQVMLVWKSLVFTCCNQCNI